MANPNNITRAIIDATVDRGLREIEEDPRRSIRKLTDMGRRFIKGRFLQDVYAIVQELLRDDDCPYYVAIERLLRFTEKKALKGFGINVGYNSLTFGAKIIREEEKTQPYLIPWALMMRYNPMIPGSLTDAEIKELIRQGRQLGIYTYSIRCTGSLAALEKITDIISGTKNSAFFAILPDQEMTSEHFAMMRNCTNTIFLLPADSEYCEQNLKNMHRQKLLCGIYASYNDRNKDAFLSGRRSAELANLSAPFVIFIADDSCSPGTRNEMARYCKATRLSARYPYFLFDFYGDAIQVDHVVSSNACFCEVMENGDLHTQNGLINDFRHTQWSDKAGHHIYR